jgi:hypothetical protein
MIKPKTNAIIDVPPDFTSSNARPDHAYGNRVAAPPPATASSVLIASPNYIPERVRDDLGRREAVEMGKQIRPGTHCVLTSADKGTISFLFERV